MGNAPGTWPAVQQNIDQFGQHLFGVFGGPDGQRFVYTIGNANHGLPELIALGDFQMEQAGLILNALGRKMRDAGKPLEGDVSLGGKYPVRIHPASDDVKSDFTVQAGQYLGHQNYSVLQVLFCDPNGVYPGEPGIDPEYNVPLL